MFTTTPLHRIVSSATICMLLSLPVAHGELVSQEERIWSPKQVKETLDSWSDKYPQLFRMESVQDKYDVPHAGNATDCPYDENHGCSQYFFTIQDFIRHPEGSQSSAHLPEVFWSGTFHGDEKHGPSVVMEAAKMLLESAACEAIPGPNPSNLEIEEAKACRVGLGLRGINPARRQWLARMAATRRVVVLPSANSLGSSRGTRREAGVDPARDFAYALEDDSKYCMRSTASRAVNEIFRDHMFQIALSFYSGSGAIGFPWRHEKRSSPDKISQLQLAQALGSIISRGSLIYEEERSPNTLFENSDTLVDFVTTTAGQSELQGHKASFEDWAYAASWDKNTSMCSPRTHGGYLPEKTRYNNSTNRAMALMTSINRETIEESLESNVNLALVSVDLVQPYVNVFGINNLALSDDIVPMNEALSHSCLNMRSVISSVRRDTLGIEWTVGGALNIEYTELFFAVNLSEEEEQALDCLMQPEAVDLKKFEKATSESKSGGSGFYSELGSDPSQTSSRTNKEDIMGPVFRAAIDLKNMKAGDRIVVIASARVDQSWNLPHDASVPSPESHLANARTNPDWNHLHNGKRIRGRLNWYSIPLAIVLEDIVSDIGALEMDNRFSQSTDYDVETTQAPSSQSTDIATETVQEPNETSDQDLEPTLAPSSQNTDPGTEEQEPDETIQPTQAPSSQSTNFGKPSDTKDESEKKKPKIDEKMHEDRDQYIVSTLNDEVASRIVLHLLITLILFSLLIMAVHVAKKRKLMAQMQSVLHAERSAEERGDITVPHGSARRAPEEGDIVDFDAVGIYNKNRGNRATVTSDHIEEYDTEVVGDVGGGDSDYSDSDDDDDDDLPMQYTPPTTHYAPPSTRRNAPRSTQYAPPEELEDVYMA